LRANQQAKLQSKPPEPLLALTGRAVGLYGKRWIRFLGYWKQQEMIFKVYGISVDAEFRSSTLLHAALEKAASHLRENPTQNTTYDAGFISIHEGRTENQLNIDQWINENELLHHIYVSPKKTPAGFRRPPRDHNAMCIWEIHVQSFERKAWMDCVLRDTPIWSKRIRRYLNWRLTAYV
jgi:hypothetical protein